MPVHSQKSITEKFFVHPLFRIVFLIPMLSVAWLHPVRLDSQCMMFPISLSEQVKESTLIVEGEVISRRVFESPSRDFLFTAYKLRVTKVFKGTLNGTELEMIEKGGTLGTRTIVVTPGISPENGTKGTFFLTGVRSPKLRNYPFQLPAFEAYASHQSIFHYDIETGKATSVFASHDLGEWYAVVQKHTKKGYTDIGTLHPGVKKTARVMQTISSISPTTLSAGTYSLLTINGSGFGATMDTSKVQFKNADDAGASWITASAFHVKSWNNTAITVWVPSQAGTGQIRVIVNGVAVNSSQTLTVTYSQFTFEYLIGSTTWLVQTHHQNDNAGYGYTFHYHTGFNSNTAARKAFERSLNMWRCQTEVNWVIGPTTSIDTVGEDGTNAIMFDQTDPIPAGVGAQTANYPNGCWITTHTSMHIKEIDMIFNDALPSGYTWEFGPDLPSSTEIDFESVCVHELGHAHQLLHVINTSQVMHYSIGPQIATRNPTNDDLAGANNVHSRSTGYPAYCGFNPMRDYRQIKYVDHSATGIQSGDSWSQAYKELQDVLTLESTCVDTIFVAKGTYYPDEGDGVTNNDEAARFHVNTPVVLLGGYPNGGGTRNLSSHTTILSGDIDKDALLDAQNSRTVVRLNSASTIDGFLIEGGYADGNSGEAKDGAGLYNTSNGIVRNVVFRNNKAQGTGANGLGGALYNSSGSPDLFNILAYDNESTSQGSAFYLATGDLECNNCTFANNGPVNGAVYSLAGNPQIRNSIFYGNGTDMIAAAGAPVLHNTMFQQASLPAGGIGDNVLLNSNPLFVDGGMNNYNLQVCSPGMNTGNNSYNTLSTDVFGATRIVGTIDRGAIEHPTGPPTTIVTSLANSGTGSLRDIVQNCCAGNTITFSSSVDNLTIGLTSGPIVVDKNLIIDGNGLNTTHISGTGVTRIFTVNAGITATLRDMNLVEGDSGMNQGNCIHNSGSMILRNLRMDSQNGTMNPFSILNTGSGTVTIQQTVTVK